MENARYVWDSLSHYRISNPQRPMNRAELVAATRYKESDNMTGDLEELVLSELSTEELVEQMHDDLYDGLKEEIEEGTTILLDRGCEVAPS